MYNTEEIESLLEKYFNAETNLPEEAVLKNYFSSEPIADHLLVYKSMFNFYLQNQDEKIQTEIKIPKSNKRTFWFGSIAAALFIMIGGIVYQQYERQKQTEKTLAETKMALELIAKQLNKGNKALQELENVDKTKNKAFRTHIMLGGK